MARYAAVDIGSNSVRMLVAENSERESGGGGWQTLASTRDVTRLGESVFREGVISPAAMEQMGGLLARMGRVIEEFGVDGVRAVATAAVRDARNQDEFLAGMSRALGWAVEIVSGQEEARLIHLGVFSRQRHANRRLLLIDVGGGSAEVIFSERGLRWTAVSKPLGAVRLREMFLRRDPPSGTDLRRMEEYIEEKIEPAVQANAGREFEGAIGTSSTAAAVVCAIEGIARARREEGEGRRVTVRQVRKLYRDLRDKPLGDRQKVTGIGPRRAELIVGGVAVFLRVMEMFGVEWLEYSGAGVKDGIVADLAARRALEAVARLDDEQRLVVEEMARKYGVAVPHARKVAELAQRLFGDLRELHGLGAESGKLLEAAAYLHDTGHFIADTAHHKHSAYIVANADMPGFTDRERTLIAQLCRFHRKAMPAARHESFQALGAEEQRQVLLLVPLLRLADGLDRSHRQEVGEISCKVERERVVLVVKGGAEVDLEMWAAERVADIFAQVYGRSLDLAGDRSN